MNSKYNLVVVWIRHILSLIFMTLVWTLGFELLGDLISLENLQFGVKLNKVIIALLWVFVFAWIIYAQRIKQNYIEFFLNWKYPPVLSWSIVLSFLGNISAFEYILYNENICMCSNSSFYPVIGLVVILGFILVIGVLYVIKIAPSYLKQRKDVKIDIESEPRLAEVENWNTKEWNDFLASDQPIESIAHDLLKLGSKAGKVAELLQVSGSCSVAVIGNYGVGKSSLINMVMSKLEEQKKDENGNIFLRVQINGWGLGRAHIAEYVLKQIIEELSLYIDTFDIKSIPQRYIHAIIKKDTRFVFLADVFKGSSDPFVTLELLDEVLVLNSIKLILCLEEIDRNIDSKQIAEELPALLDSFNKLENTSYMLAISEGEEYFDIVTKVCRHKVTITDYIAKDIKYKMLDDFLSVVLDDTGSFIFEKHAERFGIREYIKNGTVGAHSLNIDHHPAVAISRLEIGFREFKHILRNTKEIWDILKGEISRYDLLCLVTLEQCYPKAFKFIKDNFKKLRTYGFDALLQLSNKSELDILDVKSGQQSSTDYKSTLIKKQLLIEFCVINDNIIVDNQNKVESIINNLSQDSRRLTVLIHYLFCDNNESLQSLRNLNVNYLEKFLNWQSNFDDGISDVQLKKDLDDFKSNPTSQSMLVRSLCQSEKYSVHFQDLLNTEYCIEDINIMIEALFMGLYDSETLKNEILNNGSVFYLFRDIFLKQVGFVENNIENNIDEKSVIISNNLKWVKKVLARALENNLGLYIVCSSAIFLKYKNSVYDVVELYEEIILDVFDEVFNDKEKEYMGRIYPELYYCVYYTFKIYLPFNDYNSKKQYGKLYARVRGNFIKIFTVIIENDNASIGEKVQMEMFFHTKDFARKLFASNTDLYKGVYGCLNGYKGSDELSKYYSENNQMNEEQVQRQLELFELTLKNLQELAEG